MDRRSQLPWPSPITAESLTRLPGALDEVRAQGGDTYWLEVRPHESGRSALVCRCGDTIDDVLPEPWNIRSRVHEYGGGAYAVDDAGLVFVNFADNRLYRLDGGAQDPRPISPENPAVRFGALVLGSGRLFAVREDHRGAGDPANTIVVLDPAGPNAGFGDTVVAGPDFVLRPAISADGSEIAWVEYDHPNMPWDTTRLLRARLSATAASLTDVRAVVDSPGVSAAAPRWTPGGALWFASDESGWWTLHRDTGAGPAPVHGHKADFVAPPWVLGKIDFDLLDEHRALVRWWDAGVARLGVLDARSGRLDRIDADGVVFEDLQACGEDEILFLTATPTQLPSVVRGPLRGPHQALSSSPNAPLDAAYIATARAWTWTNSGGQEVHGFFFAPRNPDAAPAQGELPPLLVLVHGGPTSRVEPAISMAIQFWTTRGFAILHVNYSGSTGFGRAYRDRLQGAWGVVDVDDCVTGARSLAVAGLVDSTRLAIRGGSAGGYAVLRALTTSDVFAAGVSYFGVSDLAGLAQHTHKFESRYTFGLVAPWPEGAQVYAERSPVNDVARLHGDLLLLHGSDDVVVPLAQADDLVDALRAAGKEVELVVYAGEGHGFRRAETIVDTLERELAFYQRVFSH